MPTDNNEKIVESLIAEAKRTVTPEAYAALYHAAAMFRIAQALENLSATMDHLAAKLNH